MKDTHIVIMAGGIGNRLYPLSTPEKPKQFLDLLGTGRTLVQSTVDRFRPLCPTENFWIVTSEKYKSLIHEQLPDIPDSHILYEPVARNTAPCIAYSCWKIRKMYPQANILVTPSDAFIIDTDTFRNVAKKALEETAESGKTVMIGINPDRPHTGYGYIQCSADCSGKTVKVISFKEKPDMETAKEYLADGRYVWNAGIFIWNAETTVRQIRTHAPQIAGIMDKLDPYLFTEHEQEALAELFPLCEKISIDYAVMEKSDDIYVIGGDLGWSDLGSFESVISVMDNLGHKINPEARKRVFDAMGSKKL